MRSCHCCGWQLSPRRGGAAHPCGTLWVLGPDTKTNTTLSGLELDTESLSLSPGLTTAGGAGFREGCARNVCFDRADSAGPHCHWAAGCVGHCACATLWGCYIRGPKAAARHSHVIHGGPLTLSTRRLPHQTHHVLLSNTSREYANARGMYPSSHQGRHSLLIMPLALDGDMSCPCRVCHFYPGPPSPADDGTRTSPTQLQH
jgi:hypothetical protein